MARSLTDARRWMQKGTILISGAVVGLDDTAFTSPTELVGWTRAHIVAHLSANAEAVGRLVHWASTGEPTPMYASMEERNTVIESASQLAGSQLTEWFTRSAAQLDAAMADLTGQQWDAEVVTAQGRTVPASETPWMRAREVMVHAVDLGMGITFDDLPEDFLTALCDDVVGKRTAAADSDSAGPAVTIEATDTGGRWTVDGTAGPVTVTVRGTLSALTAYLAGRSTDGVATPEGSPAPALPAWL